MLIFAHSNQSANSFMKYRTFLIVICFSGLQWQSHAQDMLDWFTLSDVSFEQVFSEELGITYDQATFGDFVTAFDGQEVVISGYVIPLDPMGMSYALSRNPNSSCFFCGGAGPETVIDLRLKSSAMKKYRMDDLLMFKGRLKLNEKNDNQFIYELWEAEPVN